MIICIVFRCILPRFYINLITTPTTNVTSSLLNLGIIRNDNTPNCRLRDNVLKSDKSSTSLHNCVKPKNCQILIILMIGQQDKLSKFLSFDNCLEVINRQSLLATTIDELF